MKQLDFLETWKAFFGSDFARRLIFKAMDLRDSYAVLAVICHIQAAIYFLSREKSAHFQKRDCFECQSPHKIAV